MLDTFQHGYFIQKVIKLHSLITVNIDIQTALFFLGGGRGRQTDREGGKIRLAKFWIQN